MDRIMFLTKRVDGKNFNIHVEGTGEPVLFVHGFPLDHSMWTHQFAHFAQSHRVIAPDLRGFGANSPVEGLLEMSEFANDLASLLEVLEILEPVHFCGLSMGGYIAWEFFRNHRQKLKSLILCDTKASADSEDAKINREQSAQRVLAEGPEFLASSMVEKLFSPHTIEQNSGIVEQTQQVIRKTDPESIAAALRGMATRADMEATLESVDVPTLAIVGEDDSITTVDEMKRMSNAITNSQFVVVPQAGHMTPLEQPEFVNREIADFLGRLG